MMELLIGIFILTLVRFCILRHSYFLEKERLDAGWLEVDTATVGTHLVRHQHGPMFWTFKNENGEWVDDHGVLRDPYYWFCEEATKGEE